MDRLSGIFHLSFALPDMQKARKKTQLVDGRLAARPPARLPFSRSLARSRPAD